MTVFELQDSAPLPPGRRIQLADGGEGVLIWEYEARGGQGADRVEAIGIRVSILYHVDKRRRYVTSVFPLDMSPQSQQRREDSIFEAANADSRNCRGESATDHVVANDFRAASVLDGPSSAPA